MQWLFSSVLTLAIGALVFWTIYRHNDPAQRKEELKSWVRIFIAIGLVDLWRDGQNRLLAWILAPVFLMYLWCISFGPWRRKL